MIAQEPPENLDALAQQFFMQELGIAEKDIPEAQRNLVGAFDVLHRIQERINKEKNND